jgi:subtilisin family serine protease
LGATYANVGLVEVEFQRPMLIFAQLREARPVTVKGSQLLVLAVAMLAVFLASLLGTTEAVASSNTRKKSSKYYIPTSLPPVKVPPQSKTNTNSKPQAKKVDDDDDDKPATKSEPKVTDKSKKKDDDDDDQDQGKDGKSKRQDTTQARSEDAIPSTVADLVKLLLASPGGQPPAVNPGLRDGPTKLDTRTSTPAKPLQKLTGRPTGDLQLKMPSLPTNDILVRNLSPATLSRAIASGMKVESRRDLGVLGYSLTRLLIPHDMKAEQAKALLQESNPAAAVDLNQRYRLYPSAREGDSIKSPTSGEPARTTGGCGSDRCYGAATIGWQEQLAACAKGLSVGVIDTGIDSTHPSLAHQPERFKFGQFGPGFRGAGSDLHGTGVLALLAGNSKSSTPGLIPGAKFFVADIFFADENGLPVSTTLHLLEALEWMDRFRVQIINLSLSGPRDDLVQAAITRMSKPRTMDGVTKPAVIFVAAAGNGGPGAPPSYPAAYPEALAVTAVSRDLRGYRRANHGDYIDVAAPGVDIWTALPDGRQGYQTGTSFATPYMTAVVASVYRSLPLHKSKEAILQRISVQDLGSPGRDRIYGRGLVQAPTECGGPSIPWSPAVVARQPTPLAPTSLTQKTASR